MDFMKNLQNELTQSSYNVSVTENGALGYKTTGKKLLDLNFSLSSLRNVSEEEIQARFADALADDVDLAITWLFFARDIRGGMGERRTFRACLRHLAREYPTKVWQVMRFIPEYGRWDDLFCLKDTLAQKDMVYLIYAQLTEDLESYKNKKPISLLAKWMPSVNASNPKTRELGRFFAKQLGLSVKDYKNILSVLRKHLDVVERKMSANQWGDIKYEHVPSRANLNYKNAFMRHDEQRRREYLSKVERGEAEINSSVLFPHDIVHKYTSNSGYTVAIKDEDPVLEAMWKGLPDTVSGENRTIVVADGSGSMCCRIGKTDISALSVANALAIYFAEHMTGEFKNKYITFSNRPQLVDLGGSTTLRGKINTALHYCEASNTDIEKVFNLILQTAVKNHMKQEELPKNVLVISDMEFDYCAYCGRGKENLFDVLAKRYQDHGYLLPRLVFWNVNSRTNTIPIMKNDLGVALVSGFSPNVASMVMSGKLDPYEALLDTLMSDRYRPVWERLTEDVF